MLTNMIGRWVKYKEGEDKKEYIVIDYVYYHGREEVCILVDFPFHPDKIKQLRIWQNLDKFTILN